MFETFKQINQKKCWEIFYNFKALLKQIKDCGLYL